MSKISDQRVFDKENIFGKGQENSGLSEYFTGKSYVNPLTKPGESTVALANVTFEPGCRNDWHIPSCKDRRRADPDLYCRKWLVSGRRERSSKPGTGYGNRNPSGGETLARGESRQLVFPHCIECSGNRDE